LKKSALALSLLYPIFGWGTVLQPWYPEKLLELQARADYLFQAFNTVESSAGDFSYHGRDSFLDLSVLGSVEGLGAELEIILSDTHAHSFYPDCFKLTGRYQIWNDSVGDDVSLMGGLTLIAPMTEGLDDISSFHHGHFEAEAHLAVGKEVICYERWTSRYWAVGAIGCAIDEGSPWLRGDVHYENNWDSNLTLHLFLKTLWGLGSNAVHKHHFHGYGSIAHRSIDVGAQLSYLTNCDLTIALGYAYRPYAHNFPKNVSLFTLDLLYPFSL
jgi:hypothetical protein